MTQADPHTGAVPLASAEALALLTQVLEAATSAPTSIVVFDLDSTLLNNAPRQALIMREYGEEHGVEPLTTNQAAHWAGWDFTIAMANSGLDETGIATHQRPFKDYWRERFFTSDYCVHDKPIVGAVEYVTATKATGALVCYVTGRHEPMREGSIRSFHKAGFPVPDNDRVQLLMKPNLEETDDAYKARTYETLRSLGNVVGAFDNEPAHINGYKLAFPDAHSVHLATDHSLRKIKIAAGIPSIRDFADFLSR
jgi:phosphoglycolate phosphatase-like HAD superfamily hydrolase